MRNYTKHITGEEKRKMTSYLKLDSCKKIAGSIRQDSVIRKRYIILYVIAAIIFIIGAVSVLGAVPK